MSLRTRSKNQEREKQMKYDLQDGETLVASVDTKEIFGACVPQRMLKATLILEAKKPVVLKSVEPGQTPSGALETKGRDLVEYNCVYVLVQKGDERYFKQVSKERT
jgi:hypothetical protein